MARCAALKRDKTSCQGIVIGGSDYCHAHHPDRAEARKRSASKAGKKSKRGVRPDIQAELAEVRAGLAELRADVLAGRTDKGIAAVVTQIDNATIRTYSAAQKAAEDDDMDERIAELERLQAEDPGWGY